MSMKNALVKKLRNPDDLKEFFEALYNNIVPIVYSADELGLAGFMNQVCDEAVFGMDVARQLDDIAASVDGGSKPEAYRDAANQALSLMDSVKHFPIIATIATRSNEEDAEDWFNRCVSFTLENDTALGNDPSGEFGDFLDEYVR